MMRDRDAASNASKTVERTCPHRQLATKHQDICLPAKDPVLQHRVLAFETLLSARMASRLVAAQASIGQLELALREASEDAIHDPLTGLLNRRGMDEVFAREAVQACQFGHPLALALIAFDNAKRVNDPHRREFGDTAFIYLSKVIAETLISTVFIFRWSEEGFVVLIPGGDHAAAEIAMDRLKTAIASFPAITCPFRLAIRIGIVVWQVGESLEQLLERAGSAIAHD
jgi:diguanylate cyclase (GGDEF)-like protein